MTTPEPLEASTDPIAAAIGDPDISLEEAVGRAIGAASMCWENPGGAGEFDSVAASRIVRLLLERFDSHAMACADYCVTSLVALLEEDERELRRLRGSCRTRECVRYYSHSGPCMSADA